MAVTEMSTLPADKLFDLIIVGSGPAALAVLARILERRPAALYTEDEHAHLHWLHRQQQQDKRRVLLLKRTGRGQEKMLVESRKNNYDKDDDEANVDMLRPPLRILVIDRFGGWLANWRRLFAAYGITHLRSPLFFHIAPGDNNALRAFAERNASMGSSGGVGGQDGLRTRQRRRVRKEVAAERSAATSAAATNVQPPLPDLLEVAGCVGKEIPKHKRKNAAASITATQRRLAPAVNERDRRDYFTPSARLFEQFIDQDIVQRYDLHGPSQSGDDKAWPPLSKALPSSCGITLARGDVCDVAWQPQTHVQGCEKIDGFRVRVNDGEKAYTTLVAKAVVLAVGPGVSIGVPKCLQPPSGSSSPSDSAQPPPRQGPGWCHSTQLGLQGRTLRGTLAAQRNRHPVLAVIGGGLSAAQICDMALRCDGASHVHLIMRSHIKIKPFDVGLQWMGRYANLEKMCFWQEHDPQVRLEKLRAARQGGSITPRYVKLLRQYEEQRLLTIHTCTEVGRAEWTPYEEGCDFDNGTWSLQLQPSSTTEMTATKAHARRQQTRRPRASGDADAAHVEDDERILTAHFLVAATGAAPSFSNVPFLRSLVEQPQYRVPEYGGLPFLTEDLQYGSLPLFCTGAFSALQIGPAAFNLEGMRAAADRIVIRLQELALRTSEDEHETDDGDKHDSIADKQAHPRSSHHLPTSVSPFVSRYTHFAYNHLSRDVEA